MGMPQWLARRGLCVVPAEARSVFRGRHKFLHFRTWYRDGLSVYVRHILLDPLTLSRSFLREDKVEAIVASHLTGRRESHYHYSYSVDARTRSPAARPLVNAEPDCIAYFVAGIIALFLLERRGNKHRTSLRCGLRPYTSLLLRPVLYRPGLAAGLASAQDFRMAARWTQRSTRCFTPLRQCSLPKTRPGDEASMAQLARPGFLLYCLITLTGPIILCCAEALGQTDGRPDDGVHRPLRSNAVGALKSFSPGRRSCSCLFPSCLSSITHSSEGVTMHGPARNTSTGSATTRMGWVQSACTGVSGGCGFWPAH